MGRELRRGGNIARTYPRRLGIAFATAPNTFFVVAPRNLGRDVQIGDRLSLRFENGRASVDNGRGRGR